MTASITCPRCAATSYHPRDIAERYCGACHCYHDDVPAEAAALAERHPGLSVGEAGLLILAERLGYGRAEVPPAAVTQYLRARDDLARERR